MAPSQDRRRTAVLYGGFLLTGMATVLLGPLIPELEARWGVSHSQVASLFVAQFAASSMGAVISSFHQGRSLLCGYPLIAAGLAGLGFAAWPFALAAVALMGLGLGLVIPATNLRVAHAHPGRRGAALATLNLVWGLGAVSCPLLFAALLGRLPVAWVPGILAVLAALIAASLAAAIGREVASAPPAETSPAAPRSPAPGRRSAGLGPQLLLASMLFLYVGAENAVGGWLVALSDQLGGGRSALSMVIGSGFWGALLAGRGLAPALLRRMTEAALYRGSLALALVGTVAVFLAGSRGLAAAGAVAAGAGMASIYPLTVSILTRQTASSGSRGTGWVFACAGFGAAVLPWLAGRLAGDSGGLGRGFLVPVGALVLLAALFGLQRASESRGAPDGAEYPDGAAG